MGRLEIAMRLHITVALVTIFSAVAFNVEAAEFKKLSGAQIQAKFAGMELTDESHWGDIFERNGTLTTSSMGHKSVGKWRIQKDQLCLDRGKEPGGGCYEVWLSGAKVELRNGAANMPLEGVLQKPADRR
jgi:hypothetical protein